MGSQSDGPEEEPLTSRGRAFELDHRQGDRRDLPRCVDAGACARLHRRPVLQCRRRGEGQAPRELHRRHHGRRVLRIRRRPLADRRGGSTSARNGAEQKNAWGNEPPDKTRACYDHPGTCPVASFAAEPFRLFDVLSRVWKWTSSWFRLSRARAQRRPTSTAAGAGAAASHDGSRPASEIGGR